MSNIEKKIRKENETKKTQITCMVILVLLMALIFWSEKSPGCAKAQMIIGGVIIIALGFIFFIYCFIEMKFHQWAFTFILIVGGLSLLIQPILNIPDERAHLGRAELISEGNLFVDPEETEFPSIQAVQDLSSFEKTSYIKSDLKGKAINYDKTTVVHVAGSNLSFLYFPQAIGILFAKILHLNVIWMLWLGRFFNLFVYSVLISLAIKLADKWKFVLFYIASLPISIQQAASYSPDALINALSILLIAYFIHLYCKEDKSITKKELLYFGVISVLVSLAKITNIFIVGLILLIPMKNIDKKKRMVIKGTIICLVCIIGGIYYLYTTKFGVNMEHLEYLQTMHVDAGKQINYILTDTSKWLREFISSLSNQFNDIISSLNSFGYLEYGYSMLNLLTVFMFSKICFQEEKLGLTNTDKVLIILMSMGIYTFSCLALYISWTTVGTKGILGMQGRYLIPMIALTSLLFGTDKREKNHVVDVTVISSMASMMLIATTVRYY